MKNNKNEVIKFMKDIDESFCFDNIGSLEYDKIVFNPEFRKYCDKCSNYNKNWGCPPLVGDVSQLIDNTKKYGEVIIFQKIYSIKNKDDYEGMKETLESFGKIVLNIADIAKELFEDSLILSGGPCKVCETCAAIYEKPCIFPQKRISSVSVYCIDVDKTVSKLEMNYLNGECFVTYFGFLFI